MSQFDYIKDIAKYGLENDQERLLSVVNDLVEYSKKTKKVNFAIQLQSILKDALKHNQTSGPIKVGSDTYFNRIEDKEVDGLILEKLTSDYRLPNLVCDLTVKSHLEHLLQEHHSADILRKFDLPISNKILLHGPSGCGKTLASYVIAGELEKMMIVVNLGSIVSSKLGETSKNLAKIFRKASAEGSIIFIDEFDSLGKIRDYSHDHGEMKRVVNTILQLFDYLPQNCLVIAATNQMEMLDEALLRRFDVNIQFPLPNELQINELVKLTLKNDTFKFDKPKSVTKIIKTSVGLSYYSIQKTLITAIKRSIFNLIDTESKPIKISVSTEVWKELIMTERAALIKV